MSPLSPVPRHHGLPGTMAADPWKSHAARIVAIRPETPGARSYDLELRDEALRNAYAFAPGQFNKPRSLACDRADNLYVADVTGRIQKFSPDGRFLLQWQMPQTDLGKAKGMSTDPAGNILVVEPHYQRVNHFSGDGRLLESLKSEELAPLGSRMRVRLALERATPQELAELLDHTLRSAGVPKLMTPELLLTLADHAQGNPRALMNIAGELLDAAAQREARHIDEKLFLELCAAPPAPEPKAARQRR